MIEEKKFPKCRKKEKVKNGFMKGKQRYKCKCCGCNYTGGRNGYPDHIKLRAIRYYLEGNVFRRIERLMGVSHVSVINWVKKFASKFKNITKQRQKVVLRIFVRIFLTLMPNFMLLINIQFIISF